jgi:mannose-6-phosphate isomerase-like protein (cupin superfamily)
MHIVSTDTVTAYTWGAGCKAWALADTEVLSVKEESMPPGTAERDHRHQRARQFFYILRGEATLEAGEAARTLYAGEGIEIAPGIPHRICNVSTEGLRFLVISAPSTAGDRIETESRDPQMKQ